MKEHLVTVAFQPHGRTVYVLKGTKVLEAAVRAGLTVDTPCGGAGTCGKCRVQITSGSCPPTPAERNMLSAGDISQGWRLACQAELCQDAVVSIPDASLLTSKLQILTAAGQPAQEVQPAVRKAYVELSPPTLEDCEADLLRLQRAIGPLKADLAVLGELPRLMRQCGFKGTAVVTDHQLIDFEPGDTAAQCYGAAFDIGTTTLVGSLMDLSSGRELAVDSAVNPQVGYGDDVLSRIRHACDGGLQRLRELVAGAVWQMIDRLCARAGVPRDKIYEVAFAGNTTMEHLLCGIDPSQLGQVPFVPAHGESLLLPAAELDVEIHPHGMAYVFPVIGGFVGGDTVAGMLATRLTDRQGPAMMVDIGTNGEIVLAHDGELWAASAAAGPAFEGARISCGMRAAAGAIEKVVFDGQTLHCGVIANAAPIGLCGSGLIDLAAELLRCGIISPHGRLLHGRQLPADCPADLARRVVTGQSGQPEFLLTEPGNAGLVVRLTQRDVRELQLATGAIRAGINIILRKAGLKTADLTRILVAGGFGSFIRRDNAQRIGLLPTDMEHDRIVSVGNAALDGCKWALLSTAARQRGEALARLTRHVELSRDEDFQTQFAEAMIFPER